MSMMRISFDTKYLLEWTAYIYIYGRIRSPNRESAERILSTTVVSMEIFSMWPQLYMFAPLGTLMMTKPLTQGLSWCTRRY
jgi:hypothetical protein